MKTIILITLLTVYSLANASGGDHAGNGGDTYAIEFVNAAKEVVNAMRVRSSTSVTVSALENAIRDTQVESTDKTLSINGMLKDGINYPEQKRIVFNRRAWDRVSNMRTKSLFVLHEYLGILRIDDTRYNISGQLIREFAKSSLICVSVLQNAQNEFEITGKAVLDLSKRDSAEWDDSLKHYSVGVNGLLSPAFLALGVFDRNTSSWLKMNAHIDAANPNVEFSFSTNTSNKLNGFPITDGVIECH